MEVRGTTLMLMKEDQKDSTDFDDDDVERPDVVEENHSQWKQWKGGKRKIG